MYSYTARHRRFSVGGNELLRFSSSLPVFSSYPNITSFYEELSKNCEEWCESYLFSRIRDEKNKTDRGFRRRLYSLSATVSYISAEYVCISLTATLAEGKQTVATYTDSAQIWQISTGTLVPQKYALRDISKELGISADEALSRLSQMEKTPLLSQTENG